MAKTAEWSDNVAHLFPPGTTVEVHPRLADTLDGPPVTKAEKTGKVKQDGTVSFSGLLAHGPYFLCGRPAINTPEGGVAKRFRSLAFTANLDADIPGPSERVSQRETNLQTEREAKARQTVAERTPEAAGLVQPVQIIEGPRNTVNTHMDKGPGQHDPAVLEPQPHPKQEDIPASVPQRSSTPAGQATPVEPGELQPRPSQSDVKPGTPQRSSTEFGEATPVVVGEQVPGQRQEDTKNVRQRSDTPHGQAAPKPTTKSPKAQEAVRESSVTKAKGSGATAAAGTDKRKSRAKGTAAQKKAASPVKASSKRAARRQDK